MRIPAWKEPSSPQVTVPVCVGYHSVIGSGGQQQLIPIITQVPIQNGQVPMQNGQMQSAMHRQLPMYPVNQRPPLNSYRNGQILPGIAELVFKALEKWVKTNRLSRSYCE